MGNCAGCLAAQAEYYTALSIWNSCVARARSFLDGVYAFAKDAKDNMRRNLKVMPPRF